MQTKQQLELLLASAGAAPNKRLGQHFLIDLNLIKLLVDAADIKKDDIVVEVGCGTGSMTEETAIHAGKVICVELDSILAKLATRQLAQFPNVKIIHGDALKTKHELNEEFLAELAKAKEELHGRVLMVANLPYNVAAPIMLNLIVGTTVAQAMYVTVQKEVADRMIAKAGEGMYGTLSIFMAATGHVHMVRKLSPMVFWPRPQVDSAMVEYVRDEEKIKRIKSMDMLKAVVSLFIGHRRKMLKACTKFAQGELEKITSWEDVLKKAMVNPLVRPEELTADDYVNLANACNEAIAAIK